ncbi:hypothetical protein E4U43_002092, partial [Claviceps pusilla]
SSALIGDTEERTISASINADEGELEFNENEEVDNEEVDNEEVDNEEVDNEGGIESSLGNQGNLSNNLDCPWSDCQAMAFESEKDLLRHYAIPDYHSRKKQILRKRRRSDGDGETQPAIEEQHQDSNSEMPGPGPVTSDGPQSGAIEMSPSHLHHQQTLDFESLFGNITGEAGSSAPLNSSMITTNDVHQTYRVSALPAQDLNNQAWGFGLSQDHSKLPFNYSGASTSSKAPLMYSGPSTSSKAPLMYGGPSTSSKAPLMTSAPIPQFLFAATGLPMANNGNLSEQQLLPGYIDFPRTSND